MPRTAAVHRRSHAVVIGAGMAGLTAAQALSRHFERVTLVERADLPSRPTNRPDMPHGRHAHVLQPAGLAALERLLPGFEAELRSSGAVRLETPSDVCWLSPAGSMRPFDAERRVMLSATSELIAWVARRLVFDTPQIIVRSGLEATGLVVVPPTDTAPGGRVRAVEVRPRLATTSGPTESIVADLVVDASGRRSRAPGWLAAAGYERPAETLVDADLAYATRIYRRTSDDAGGWKAVLLQARPPHTHLTGGLFPIEGDRWMLTVVGSNGANGSGPDGGGAPPTDEHGFRAFIRALRAPTLASAVEDLEPLSPIVGYRRTGNWRRHYESLDRVPDGFVVVGDAACAVDPVYGQGVGAAALAAEALDQSIDDHLDRFRDLAGVTARAQKAVAEVHNGFATRPRTPVPA